MTSREKYENAFLQCFKLEPSYLNSQLIYMSIPEWDSVGHMQLMAILEDAFDIMMDTDDIIDFSSYDKGKEILKKYKVEL